MPGYTEKFLEFSIDVRKGGVGEVHQLPGYLWTKYVHVNGNVYFYNSHYRIITPHDMSDPDMRDTIVEEYNRFDSMLRRKGLNTYLYQHYPETDMVIRFHGDIEDDYLEISLICPSRLCFMYCPEEGEFDLKVLTGTVKIWTYLEEFPMHWPPNTIMAVHDCIIGLTHGVNEWMDENNQYCSFPYSDHQIQRMMQVFKDLKNSVNSLSSLRVYEKGGYNQAIATFLWHSARVMYRIESGRERHKIPHPKMLNVYGFKLEDKPPVVTRTPFDRRMEILLGILLLGAHFTFLERLSHVRRSGRVIQREFSRMMVEFLAGWSDSNLLSTVFVGANVSFLGLSVITGIQRTTVLISTMFSVLSVLSGLYHVWHHRSKINADVNEAWKYINHTRDPGRYDQAITDLQVLATFLALPIASLSWAIILFSIAMVAYCVQNVGTKVGEITLLVLVGAMVCLFAIIFVVPLKASDQKKDGMTWRYARWVWERVRFVINVKARISRQRKHN
ncbi:hypothetical protein C8Q75DRAFT_503945 [Abortiporus biennis]|nr:hypothetical protein C8Q75DRAFT_503945 [Abortiporus biennis]